jgi:hypothetical protein
MIFPTISTSSFATDLLQILVRYLQFGCLPGLLAVVYCAALCVGQELVRWGGGQVAAARIKTAPAAPGRCVWVGQHGLRVGCRECCTGESTVQKGMGRKCERFACRSSSGSWFYEWQMQNVLGTSRPAAPTRLDQCNQKTDRINQAHSTHLLRQLFTPDPLSSLHPSNVQLKTKLRGRVKNAFSIRSLCN